MNTGVMVGSRKVEIRDRELVQTKQAYSYTYKLVVHNYIILFHLLLI